MSKTKIEWADRVWNPVTGCTKVSAGCKNCYAETYAKRFWGKRGFNDIQTHEGKLWEPTRIKKPNSFFVNSMSDLFHPNVNPFFIAKVFGVMALCPQHTFLVLTKRPGEALKFMNWCSAYQYGIKNSSDVFTNPLYHCLNSVFIEGYLLERKLDQAWPLPNVWLGVSVEDQATADERIPLLLQTSAAVRWISAEPLLGEINLHKFICKYSSDIETGQRFCNICESNGKLNWVVCGGESGHGARPMRLSWARSLRDQCQASGTPFFFKQWGEWEPCKPNIADIAGEGSIRVGKSKSGRLLDGIEHNEFPKSKGENQNG